MGNSPKLQQYRKRVLVSGGLTFDTLTGVAYSNKKDSGQVHFKMASFDRLLLEHLMRNQDVPFSYQEIVNILDKGEKVSRSKNTNKSINDRIDSLKKKLSKLGFSREELSRMFICDGGYTLIQPRNKKMYGKK